MLSKSIMKLRLIGLAKAVIKICPLVIFIYNATIRSRLFIKNERITIDLFMNYISNHNKFDIKEIFFKYQYQIY